MVAHAKPHHDDRLIQSRGNRVQAREVVLIVLRRSEGHLRIHARQVQMDAVDLADRHLPLLQLEGLERRLHLLQHHLAADAVLFGQAGLRYRMQPS